jgi:hypothetical protein
MSIPKLPAKKMFFNKDDRFIKEYGNVCTVHGYGSRSKHASLLSAGDVRNSSNTWRVSFR